MEGCTTTRRPYYNQEVVLFVGSDNIVSKPSKIGNLFINRFAIDEDERNEILRIYQIGSSFPLIQEYKDRNLQKQVGTDLI